jgi:hypothetical protein
MPRPHGTHSVEPNAASTGVLPPVVNTLCVFITVRVGTALFASWALVIVSCSTLSVVLALGGVRAWLALGCAAHITIWVVAWCGWVVVLVVVPSRAGCVDGRARCGVGSTIAIIASGGRNVVLVVLSRRTCNTLGPANVPSACGAAA